MKKLSSKQVSSVLRRRLTTPVAARSRPTKMTHFPKTVWLGRLALNYSVPKPARFLALAIKGHNEAAIRDLVFLVCPSHI